MKRWNPFGGTTAQPTTATTPATPLAVVDTPHVVTPPDAKYFGLENASTILLPPFFFFLTPP